MKATASEIVRVVRSFSALFIDTRLRPAVRCIQGKYRALLPEQSMDAQSKEKSMLVRTTMFAALLFVLLGATPAYAENWKTEFVLKNDDPDHWDPLNFGYSDEQKPVVAELEIYLGEVAAYYESMGFRAPKLPSTEGKYGGQAYLVYLYDYPDNLTPARAGYYSDGSIDLRIDLSRAIVNGAPSGRIYEDLAHELFHNVQRAYLKKFEYDHGNWMTEGQAQAVGMDTAYRLRNKMRFRTKNEAYRLGGRPYYTPLPTNTHDHTYRTSSFWRYLGEHYAARKTNKRAGIKPIPADYSYLARLFEHPFKKSASKKADLRWLDKALEKEFGMGLDRLYPNFITTFAEYVPTRLNKMSGTPAEAAETWRNYILDECEVRKLEMPLAPTGRIGLKLDRNAARCFTVYARGLHSGGWADISMTARSGSREALQALYIGTDGGTKLGRPRITRMSKTGGGGFLGSWQFRIPMGKYQVFVVSNVAEDAETSQQQTVTLDLVMSTWLSSMTQPIQQTAPLETETAKTAEENETENAASKPDEDEESADLDFLTNTSAAGVEVQMEAYNPGCDEPFRFRPCGHSMSIHLTLVPGAMVASDILRIGSAGSWMGQIRNMATNIAAIKKGYEAAWRRLSQMEGAYVTIEIPAISYGFSGSFDNALITVGGREDTRYESVGPRNANPGGQIHYPLSGNVMIEEFTPVVLRGRFSATLVDADPKELQAVLPVYKTISGQFVIASPWKGDPGIERMVPSANASVMSVKEAFPVMLDGPLEGLADRNDPPGGESDGAMTGASIGRGYSRVPSCNCSCQPLESYSQACRPVCEVKVRQCEATERWNASSLAALRKREAQAESAMALKANAFERMFSEFADDRFYGTYLATLKLAKNKPKTREVTREEYKKILLSMDLGEVLIGKMLNFFDDANASPKSPKP